MPKSIFIIDDYPINLLIAEKLIRNHGFYDSTRSYLQADRALEHIINNKDNEMLLPDAVLIDLDMPGMSGWDFLEELEHVRPVLAKWIDVFILTSSVEATDEQRAKQYPVVKGYFQKPFLPHMLQDISDTNLASTG